MKNSKFICGALLASIAFTACSESDKITDQTEQEVVTSDGFKLLTSVTFNSELGESEDASAESRTPASVNEQGRPTGEYLLPFVNVLKTDVSNQPTAADKGHLIELNYTNAEQERHDFVGGVKGRYDVYYKIVEDGTQDEGCSVQGTVTLKQVGEASDGITYTLSVFADNVIGKEKITANDFPYGKVTNGIYRGSSMRYLTYNALADQQAAGTVTLPEITDDAIKSIVCSDGKSLYGEQVDNLFLSNELLFCADEDYLYVYEVLPYDNEFGGYELLRKYSLNGDVSQPTAFKMQRLTSIVSASFILVDEADGIYNPETSYFVEGDLNTSADNFKSKFHTDLDLTSMECRYATIDGMNTKYNINDRSDDNTSDPGRVLLWGDGYSVTGNDGIEYTWDKLSKLSANVSYNLSNGAAKGVGIEGMSYCAVYKGTQSDTKGQPIKFYVTVGDKKIVVSGLHTTGFYMNQNVAKHIVLLVPAQDFANFYNNLTPQSLSRSGNNGYAEFVVPSENVIVK